MVATRELQGNYSTPFGSQMEGRKFNGGDYRFGFNGQEKDNEITGNSNINTAMFWEYDTRSGRRWNIDPKPNSSISDYACFANNPIWNSDLLGDKFVNAHDKDKEKGEKDVKDLTKQKEDFKSNNSAVFSKSKDELTRQDKVILRQYRKITRQLNNAQEDLAETTQKWEATNTALKNFKDANPSVYNQWDNLKVKDGKGVSQKIDIEVSATFRTILMKDENGIPYSSTDESTEYGRDKTGAFKPIKVSLKILRDTKANAGYIGQTRLLVHGLGHVHLFLSEGKKDYKTVGEPHAIDYAYDNFTIFLKK